MESNSNPYLFDSSRVPDIQKNFTTRCGKEVCTEASKWALYSGSENYFFNFDRLESIYITRVAKIYCSFNLQTKSLPHSENCLRVILEALGNISDSNNLETDIINSILEFIKKNRNTHSEYRIWYLKNWYSWCSNLSLPFFKKDFKESLSNIKISGNIKGQNVLSMDEDEGPLNEEELNKLTKCLLEDENSRYIKERLYLLLSLSLGCNRRNLLLLRWEDLRILKNGDSEIFLLNVPRIKKRLARDREEFKTRELDSRIGKILKQNMNSGPIFGEGVTGSTFNGKVKIYVVKLGIEFVVTARRLRYTFATRLVMNGVSKEKLAELLDHSDLQHVQVYYDLREKIKDFLSEAESKELGAIFKRFKGKISKDSGDGDILYSYTQSPKKSILGKCGSNELCSLNPPFSCIVCPKFNAFSDSLDVYKQMLAYLVSWSKDRKDTYGDNERIHSLMHDVQLALGDLIKRIESKEQA